MMNSHAEFPLNISLPSKLEHFIKSLLVRANAKYLAHGIGFVDEAAEVLVRQMGAGYIHSKKHFDTTDYQDIIRCAWIDQCLLPFFKKYPHAIGIDIGCGFNTRFQRLSYQLDWPQFNWVDLDDPQLTAIKSGYLPNIDNYKLMDLKHSFNNYLLSENWLRSVGWEASVPIIIIFDDSTQNLNLHEFVAILNNLSKQAEGSIIEVVFDYQATNKHTPSNLLQLLRSLNKPELQTSIKLDTQSDSDRNEVVDQIKQSTQFDIKAQYDLKKRLLSTKRNYLLEWLSEIFPISAYNLPEIWQGLHLSLRKNSIPKAQEKTDSFYPLNNKPASQSIL